PRTRVSPLRKRVHETTKDDDGRSPCGSAGGPIMTGNPKMGELAYYERLFEVEAAHWWSRGMRDIATGILAGEVPDRNDLRVLDAGCGSGITLSWLEKYGRPEGIVGIDVSFHAVQFCQQRGFR